MNKYKTKAAVEKLLGVEVEEKNGRFYVGGSLDLRGTQITALPENLTVGGSLYLRGTQITALPENLTVGGSLDLEGMNHISKDIVHCGCFRGTLIEFEAKVNCTHPYGVFREEYDSFIKDAKTLKEKYESN